MKAVILAAGVGSRLGSMNNDLPKPLLKVRGEPVLERNIKILKSLGVKDIYINTHYKSKMIMDYFGDGSRYDVRIKYSYEEELLGTSGALKNFEQYLHSDFFVIYGDNYFDFNLDDFIKFHFEKKASCTIGLYYREDVSESGVVFLDDKNLVSSFIEKPGEEYSLSNLVNTGVYICSPIIFKYIPDGFSDFGKNIFPLLLEKKFSLYGYILKGLLLPIDNPSLFKKAEEF